MLIKSPHLQALRVLKALRLLRLQRVMGTLDDPIYTQLFKVIFTEMFIIFLSR